tara:strand:+ start:157 stop:339 length:183 start_codon:yes stop_codon:yes gene_type:complete
MVAFARAKAKSIFSKLHFTALSKEKVATFAKEKHEKKYNQKEINSNYFLEAIKSGGIWLS